MVSIVAQRIVHVEVRAGEGERDRHPLYNLDTIIVSSAHKLTSLFQVYCWFSFVTYELTGPELFRDSMRAAPV